MVFILYKVYKSTFTHCFRFDRAVEKELSKVKTPSTAQTVPAFPECMKTLSGLNLNYPQSIIDKMAEASASQIEIIADMAMEPDTELTDAVEKLAKAEAMCAFAGAVKAAEEAAEGTDNDNDCSSS